MLTKKDMEIFTLGNDWLGESDYRDIILKAIDHIKNLQKLIKYESTSISCIQCDGVDSRRCSGCKDEQYNEWLYRGHKLGIDWDVLD